MVSPEVEIKNWYEVLKNQAVERNDKSVATWSKYKNELEETKLLLSLIPKKVKHDVMVPIGPKAMMPGKIVHTNEFLVNLGEAWFVSRSAHQATEICERRIKTCEEMLKKLETEMQLIVNRSTLPAEHEAFGSEERPEIIEFVSEEENEEWKKQHRLREKKYRQELAEMRTKEKKKIETEEDLWRHLDELEAQEELEDELNRLHAECSSEEDVPDEDSEPGSTGREEPQEKDGAAGGSGDGCRPERRVSFACDQDFSDEEPLRLEIKHSAVEPAVKDASSGEVTSPGDIYDQYIKVHKRTLPSALKKSVNYKKESKCKFVENLETEGFDSDENPEDYVKPTSVIIKDVVERRGGVKPSSALKADSAPRKISIFKSLRMKNS